MAKKNIAIRTHTFLWLLSSTVEVRGIVSISDILGGTTAAKATLAWLNNVMAVPGKARVILASGMDEVRPNLAKVRRIGDGP